MKARYRGKEYNLFEADDGSGWFISSLDGKFTIPVKKNLTSWDVALGGFINLDGSEPHHQEYWNAVTEADFE